MKKLLSILLLTSALAAACSEIGDSPLSPDQDGNRSTTATITEVRVLQRISPLSRDIPVIAAIGRNGGTIEIPEAGLKVIFPENAVKHSTTITVTAHKGSAVAYTFQPHGLVFREPLLVHQDAKVTEAYKNPAFNLSAGAYFASPDALSGSVAKVSEFRTTDFDLTGSKFKWTIEHFSGYLLSVP